MRVIQTEVLMKLIVVSQVEDGMKTEEEVTKITREVATKLIKEVAMEAIEAKLIANVEIK